VTPTLVDRLLLFAIGVLMGVCAARVIDHLASTSSWIR
jgi:hypothetical protein